MTTANLAAEFRTAVRAAADTLFAGTATHVGYTTLAVEYSNDVVLILGISGEQTPGALGTSRARDETLRIDVVVTSFKEGDDAADKEAYDAAAANLDALTEQVRKTSGDTTLGGTVMSCFLERFDAVGADVVNDGDVTVGRVCEITATLKADVRIRGL